MLLDILGSFGKNWLGKKKKCFKESHLEELVRNQVVEMMLAWKHIGTCDWNKSALPISKISLFFYSTILFWDSASTQEVGCRMLLFMHVGFERTRKIFPGIIFLKVCKETWN